MNYSLLFDDTIHWITHMYRIFVISIHSNHLRLSSSVLHSNQYLLGHHLIGQVVISMSSFIVFLIHYIHYRILRTQTIDYFHRSSMMTYELQPQSHYHLRYVLLRTRYTRPSSIVFQRVGALRFACSDFIIFWWNRIVQSHLLWMRLVIPRPIFKFRVGHW